MYFLFCVAIFPFPVRSVTFHMIKILSLVVCDRVRRRSLFYWRIYCIQSIFAFGVEQGDGCG